MYEILSHGQAQAARRYIRGVGDAPLTDADEPPFNLDGTIDRRTALAAYYLLGFFWHDDGSEGSLRRKRLQMLRAQRWLGAPETGLLDATTGAAIADKGITFESSTDPRFETDVFPHPNVHPAHDEQPSPAIRRWMRRDEARSLARPANLVEIDLGHVPVAPLQRFFAVPVTGVFDRATSDAIARYAAMPDPAPIETENAAFTNDDRTRRSVIASRVRSRMARRATPRMQQTSTVGADDLQPRRLAAYALANYYNGGGRDRSRIAAWQRALGISSDGIVGHDTAYAVWQYGGGELRGLEDYASVNGARASQYVGALMPGQLTDADEPRMDLDATRRLRVRRAAFWIGLAVDPGSMNPPAEMRLGQRWLGVSETGTMDNATREMLAAYGVVYDQQGHPVVLTITAPANESQPSPLARREMRREWARSHIDEIRGIASPDTISDARALFAQNTSDTSEDSAVLRSIERYAVMQNPLLYSQPPASLRASAPPSHHHRRSAATAVSGVPLPYLFRR